MLVYVDESGDAGLNMAQGSSAYFVVNLSPSPRGHAHQGWQFGFSGTVAG